MKQCPNCQGEQFKVKLNVIALATVGDDMSPIIQQTLPEFTTIEELICNNCNTVINLEDLNTKQCVRCGKTFKADEINEKGHCKLCEIIEERFASMTQEDLIKTILKLESEKEIAEKTVPEKPKSRRSRKNKAEDKEAEQPVDPQAEEPAVNEDEAEDTNTNEFIKDLSEQREEAANNNLYTATIPPVQESTSFQTPEVPSAEPFPTPTTSPFNEFDPNNVEFNF